MRYKNILSINSKLKNFNESIFTVEIECKPGQGHKTTLDSKSEDVTFKQEIINKGIVLTSLIPKDVVEYLHIIDIDTTSVHKAVINTAYSNINLDTDKDFGVKADKFVAMCSYDKNERKIVVNYLVKKEHYFDNRK